MDALSEKITKFYIKKNFVSIDKKEIYSYGFKLIISDFINYFIIIILGILSSSFLESVLFIITLYAVRRFSGGFHAKTFWLCRISMIITFSCVIMTAKAVYENYNSNDILIMNFINVIVIALLAPIKNSNKTLSLKQKKINKIKAIIASVIMSVLSAFLIAAGIYEGVTISITLTAIVVLMIIGIAAEKGGKGHV